MSAGGEGKFRKKYSFYAARYGSNERSLKRWVAHGRKQGDACPLDEPEKMREWWARNMSQRCPDKLLAAAVEARKENGQSAVEPVAAIAKPNLPPAPVMELPVVVPKEELVLPRREFLPVNSEEVGIEATLQRLQEAEVLTHRIYKEALENNQDAQAKLALKSFTDLADQVAKAQEKATRHRRDTGDLIPRVPLEAAMGEFHQEFHNLLRGSSPLFFRLFGIPPTAENEAKWQELIDGVCEQLHQEVLAKP